MRYLKCTINLKLVYEKISTMDMFTGYDANWGGHDYKNQKTKRVMYFNSVISWNSRRRDTTALSITDAEYMALTDAICEALNLIGIAKGIGCKLNSPITIYEDNERDKSLAPS